MSTSLLLAGSLGLMLWGSVNALRAWRWKTVPIVLEGREHLFPAQIPGVIFFAGGPVLIGLDALFGHPAPGSSLAIVAGVCGGLFMVSGGVLVFTTTKLGWPRWMIAPLVRDRAPGQWGRWRMPGRRR